jgi:hypothetical protein
MQLAYFRLVKIAIYPSIYTVVWDTMGNTLGRAMRSSHKRPLDPAVAAQALNIKEKGKKHEKIYLLKISSAMLSF